MTHSHEPECDVYESQSKGWYIRIGRCTCDKLRRAYRRGYNAHAVAHAIGCEMYGDWDG